MVNGMKQMFEEVKPKKLRTDRGSEYVNRDVKKYLSNEDVKHFTTTNEMKANFVERAI